MSAFRELVAADNHEVFMNLDELAETRSVRYDGTVYVQIPVVLTGAEEQARERLSHDHAEGLYRVTDVLYCPAESLGGCTPEQGRTLELSEDGAFFRRFRVERSVCELGMLEIELEAIDE